MDIGAHAVRARALAQLLLTDLDAHAPGLREVAAGAEPLAPALEDLGVTVTVTDSVPDGCSVAGSCDRLSKTITVVQAGVARMRFTALHELAHLLGDDHDDFQTELHRLADATRRPVEEDACEAFAAALLLPDAVVDKVLSVVTARAVAELVATAPSASREACAVAAAQRLRAPGYVMLLNPTGAVVFAARSGDAFPIARGTPQNGSVLDPLVRSGQPVRDRGELVYASGSRTQALYADAAEVDGVRYVVAVTDHPDWEVLHVPDRSSAADRGIEGYCEQCSTDFTSWRRCDDCGEPRHAECNTCGCSAPTAARGARTCRECFEHLPAGCFPDASDVCERHPRPR
jgi:hypothetical protein